jgi:transcriptional antiterminator RfaH
MAYWAACRLHPNRTALALYCLNLKGYEVYCPRLRERRMLRGRRVEVLLPLFPGYTFLRVVTGWWQARWAPGTCGLVMDGATPAKVPDAVMAEIRSRERKGASTLPPQLRAGYRVCVLRGPFRDQLAIYAGMSGRDRVAVLLRLLGGMQRATLAQGDIEMITSDL